MLWRGSSSFNLSSDKAESILRGEETPLRYKVRLRVEPEAGEPYEVKAKLPVPVMKAGRLRAGSHEEGSIGELFADNPLARAALERAGLDPDKIAREADSHK
jgi:hypothetical protein